jgi:hypothetical protein
MPPFFRSLVGLHSIIEPTLNFSLRPTSFHKFGGLFGPLPFAINYDGSEDGPTIAVPDSGEKRSFTSEKRACERGIGKWPGLPPVPPKHSVNGGGITASNYECHVEAHGITLCRLWTVWTGAPSRRMQNVAIRQSRSILAGRPAPANAAGHRP